MIQSLSLHAKDKNSLTPPFTSDSCLSYEPLNWLPCDTLFLFFILLPALTLGPHHVGVGDNIAIVGKVPPSISSLNSVQ